MHLDSHQAAPVFPNLAGPENSKTYELHYGLFAAYCGQLWLIVAHCGLLWPIYLDMEAIKKIYLNKMKPTNPNAHTYDQEPRNQSYERRERDCKVWSGKWKVWSRECGV